MRGALWDYHRVYREKGIMNIRTFFVKVGAQFKKPLVQVVSILAAFALAMVAVGAITVNSRPSESPSAVSSSSDKGEDAKETDSRHSDRVVEDESEDAVDDEATSDDDSVSDDSIVDPDVPSDAPVSSGGSQGGSKGGGSSAPINNGSSGSKGGGSSAPAPAPEPDPVPAPQPSSPPVVEAPPAPPAWTPDVEGVYARFTSTYGIARYSGGACPVGNYGFVQNGTFPPNGLGIDGVVVQVKVTANVARQGYDIQYYNCFV